MSDGPEEMGDEAADIEAMLRQLEEIAERLAATTADPIAFSDFWLWKAEHNR